MALDGAESGEGLNVDGDLDDAGSGGGTASGVAVLSRGAWPGSFEGGSVGDGEDDPTFSELSGGDAALLNGDVPESPAGSGLWSASELEDEWSLMAFRARSEGEAWVQGERKAGPGG